MSDFANELTMDVKQDAFLHFAVKPKENLSEFASRFYLENQQLMTNCQITIKDAFFSCTQALKLNTLFCLHFQGQRASMCTTKDIKPTLKLMFLVNSGSILSQKQGDSSSGTTSSKPKMLALESKEKDQPKQQGCHNCGQ